MDTRFDGALGKLSWLSMPRPVMAEISGLDGAVVSTRSGKVIAYGAVLRPRRKGRLRGTEGSRTKAAVGSSNYGVAVKVSSDGDISIYHKGKVFLAL